MRSMTFTHLPGRCPRCWIRLEHCICAELPRVETRTRFVLVRHEREAAKSTGTARIATLALPALQVISYGDDPAEADQALLSLEDAWLLYPARSSAGAPAPPGVPEAPSELAPSGVEPRALTGPLVVLDGTWRQTRKMFRKLSSLRRLPRLSLPHKPGPVLRLREAHFDDARSTLEAIADALRLLEGNAVAAPLDALHARYVELVFRARGVWELKRRTFVAG